MIELIWTVIRPVTPRVDDETDEAATAALVATAPLMPLVAPAPLLPLLGVDSIGIFF